MNKLGMLLGTSRPVSWVNTAYPFAAGYVMTGGQLDAVLVVGTLFFLVPYNLLMYGINDVFDYESDVKNPRKGGIEGAVTPRSQHQLIVAAAVLGCVPFVGALLLWGSAASAAVLAAVLFGVVAYSAPGLRFKERAFLDSATSSLHFVGPMLYALSLHGFPAGAWPYVAAFFLWGMASHAFGAVQDVLPDRQAGIGSVATVFGAAGTVRFAAGCYLLAVALLAAQGGYSVVVAAAGVVYVLNVLPYARLTDAQSAGARHGWRRFIWLNYPVGMIITLCLIAARYGN